MSKKLSIPFYDLDEQIVSHEGKSINEIFETQGEEQFRLLEKQTLHIITESHDSLVMACGGGTPCYFNNIGYMNQAGITVWLDTPVPLLFERLLKGKEKRPLIKDLSDDQLRSYIIKKFSDRKIYYEQAAVTIQEQKVELDELIEKIFHV